MALNIELLEQSFAKLKPQQTDFVNSFYENMFSDYPQVQPLFAHTNMAEQKKHLFAALALVIDNLRKPDKLAGTLHELGKRHLKYGTLPAHYPVVGEELLKTMAAYLGDDWTPELKQAWVDAYTAIEVIMLEGAAEN